MPRSVKASRFDPRLFLLAFVPCGAQDLSALESVSPVPIVSWTLESVPFSLAFAPDGRKAVAGTQDGSLVLLDLESERMTTVDSGRREAISSLAVAPDGSLALGAQGVSLVLWDTAVVRELAVWRNDPPALVSAVDFSPDGKRALSGGYDNTLTLWDVSAGRGVARWRGHKAWVNSVAFSPDGRRALSSSYDGTIRLWDAETGKSLSTWQGHDCWVYSLAYSSDGRRAVSGSRDTVVKLWDVDSGRELSSRQNNQAGELNSLAITRDGRQTLSGSWDGTLRLRDSGSGVELALWNSGSAWVSSVAVSPDGSVALSGDGDRRVTLWRISRDSR